MLRPVVTRTPPITRRSLASHSSPPPPQFVFPSKPSPTPFEIFHLPPSATTQQIKERYYQLVKIYHPDVASKSTTTTNQKQNNYDQVALKFKLIRDAYELLSSPSRRENYIRFRQGWQNSRSITPNRSWANPSTASTSTYQNRYSDSDGLSSIWTKIFHNRNYTRSGFYSSSESNQDWNSYYNHSQGSSSSSSYTFRQQWERDGLFTKNGIFITSVGCISLFLYLVQLWRVLPLVRSENHLDSVKNNSSDREKIKFKKFIEPEGDERLDQEAWSKIKPIQFTKLNSNASLLDLEPLLVSSLTKTSDKDQLSTPLKSQRRLIPSSFQDQVERQNLKSVSDLKSARAAAVKPSVFSTRRLSSSQSTPPPSSIDSSSATSHSS